MQRYFAINEKLELKKEDIHHIINVMRMDIKDKFEVIENECIFICQIENISKNDIKYKVIKEDKNVRIKENKITLCISLIKNFDYVLQKATELGVDEIIPLKTSRSVVKVLEGNVENKLNRWNKICKEASEQSKRTNIPVINRPTSIKELNIDKKNVNILCSVNKATTSLSGVMKKTNKSDTICIVIGPEGGLDSDEEDYLIKQGFIPTSLGNNVLKAETVPIFILSIINYEFMR